MPLKTITVVMASHVGDKALALQLMKWIATLGCCKNRHITLILDKDQQESMKPLPELAAKAFGTVYVLAIEPCPWERKWPRPQNWAFLQYIKDIKDWPFLWLEPDSFPTKQGWLNLLEAEYNKAGKPFMGTIVKGLQPPLPPEMLQGVAIYPPDARGAIEKRIINESQNAWDVSAAITVVPYAHDSAQFQHMLKPMDPKWKVSDLRVIKPTTTLFHGDKFGTLCRMLMLRQITAGTKPVAVKHVEPEPEPEQVKAKPAVAAPKVTEPIEIGVVITTHNRFQHLKAALKSCHDAGIKEIVVTATGYKHTAWIKKLVVFPDRLILNKTDNANDAWLAGVREIKSKWCHILHDDDKVTPDFRTILEKTHPTTFALFHAYFHTPFKDVLDQTCDGPYTEGGVQNTGVLSDFLRTNGRLAITPVRGLFKTDDLEEWIQEAGKVLPKECELREGFLVGNDLWIYIRASRKYSFLSVVTNRIVSLGTWDGSTTIHALNSGTDGELLRIYDKTRDVFAETIKVEVQSTMPLHILTIVRDGAPFLMGQLQVLNRLKEPWNWSIVHGDALPNHCTRWCKRIPKGTPSDNTETILRDLAHHKRIRIFSQPEWDGKVAMVNCALTDRREILVEIDCDEFWESSQLETIRKMFISEPRSHAMFWCRFFVGPGLVMDDHDCYANNPQQEWRRAWLREPEQRFLTHEPPVMSGDQSTWYNHAETKANGLVFDHYAYSLRSQVQFKELYYGYSGAPGKWDELQKLDVPTKLESVFPWAKNSGNVKPV